MIDRMTNNHWIGEKCSGQREEKKLKRQKKDFN